MIHPRRVGPVEGSPGGEALSIAQLTAFYPPKTGGVERVAQRLAVEASRRHHVEVLTSAVGGSPGSEQVGSSLVVRRFRSLTVLGTPIFPQAVAALRRLPGPTVLHVHVSHAYVTELAAAAAAVTGWPMVAHFHMEVEPSRGGGGVYRAYKQKVLGPVLRRAAQVVVLSATQAAFVADTYRVAPSSIAIVPNGVDHHPGAEMAQAPVPGRPVRLLFVGRLAPQKNLPRLFEAVARLTVPWELVVVGDGPEGPAARRAADAAGGSVRFVGAQSATEVASWMAQAHLLVSSSDNEGMPLTFLEAMAAGLPIVATDVVGSRETLAGVGILVRPDPAGLAQGIERATADQAHWGALADAGRRLAESRSWEASGLLMDQVYAKALGHRQHPA